MVFDNLDQVVAHIERIVADELDSVGEKMEEIIPNSMDAVAEKHIPTYEKVEDEISVKVNHVMDKEHYIEWLAMIAGEKICKIKLYPEQNAECRFKYIPGSKIYAYCNKHGLWSTEIK